MKINQTNYSALIVPVLAGLSVLIPLVLIVVSSFQSATNWQHIIDNLLNNYLTQTVVLVMGVAVTVAVLGFGFGYLLGVYRFPGDKLFSWLLIFPLITPAYILAIFGKSFFSFGGIFYQITGSTLSFLNIPGAIVVFSLSLFPYVFIPVKSFFENQGAQFILLSSVYNISVKKRWVKVLLPISAPFVLGGVILAVFEVINDYGVCKLFGIQTLGVGIFRAWFGLGDFVSSLRLALVLAAFAFGVFGIDYWVKKRLHLYSTSIGSQYSKPHLSPAKAYVAILVCAAVVLLSVVIPMFEILRLCLYSIDDINFSEVTSGLVGSIQIAFPTALLCVFVLKVVSTSSKRFKHSTMLGFIEKLVGLGYGIPGAIFGVGLLYAVLQMDNTLYQVEWFRTNNFFLSGSIFVLVWAISIRLFAVAKSPIENGVKTLPENTYQVLSVFNKGGKFRFWKIEIPLLKPYLLAAFIMVFIDAVKELPITLMLRPYNFNTLASKTFELANDELVAQSAWPAMLMVAFGIIPIVLIKQLLKTPEHA